MRRLSHRTHNDDVGAAIVEHWHTKRVPVAGHKRTRLQAEFRGCGDRVNGVFVHFETDIRYGMVRGMRCGRSGTLAREWS